MLIKTSKNMKKVIYALIILLVVVSGLVFANRETKKDTVKKSPQKQPAAADQQAAMKQWEATPDGIHFNKWKTSAKGKKVLAGAEKLDPYIKDSSKMEAVITSLSLPPGSRLGFGIMAQIEGVDYILSFGLESAAKEFELLRGLKVNDKIMIRSNGVSYAPKYAYPIVAGDYVERDGKMMYKSAPRKGGC
jgi:hypothetical protein